MRKNRVIGQDRCYHLISRVAHRAYFLDGDERTRLVDFGRGAGRSDPCDTDHCRKQKAFECGEFTLAALNAGRFDDKICTEIHAWAQMNIGTGLGPKRKDVVISGAVNSVLQGCEISKAKPDSVDDNFTVELKKRVEQMYDKCKEWDAK